MVKPIGRVWFNKNCISGYVVLGNLCVKFAGANDRDAVWLFPPKEKGEDLIEEAHELLDESDY